jgi:hypothetical protein
LGEEVAIRQAGQVSAIPDAKEITALYKLGQAMARSGMFADARQEFQAMTKLVLGRDLGLSATAAMTGIYIFDNKVELSSNLQAQMIRTWLGLGGERYDYSVDEHTDDTCVISIYRVPAGVVYGNPEKVGYDKLGTGEFTRADAVRAGLANKPVWKNYPMNMLFARAMSNAIAFHCPEVTGGVRLYAPGEVSGSEDPGARAVAGVGDFQNRQGTLERRDAAGEPEPEPQDAEVVHDEPEPPVPYPDPLTPEQRAEQDRLDATYGETAPWESVEGTITEDPAEVVSASATAAAMAAEAAAAPPAEEPAFEADGEEQKEDPETLKAFVVQGLIEIGENEKMIEARLRGAGNNVQAMRNLLKFIESKKQQKTKEAEGGK